MNIQIQLRDDRAAKGERKHCIRGEQKPDLYESKRLTFDRGGLCLLSVPLEPRLVKHTDGLFHQGSPSKSAVPAQPPPLPSSLLALLGVPAPSLSKPVVSVTWSSVVIPMGVVSDSDSSQPSSVDVMFAFPFPFPAPPLQLLLLLQCGRQSVSLLE